MGTNRVAVNTLPGCLGAQYSYVSYYGLYKTLIRLFVYLLMLKKCLMFDDNCLNVSRHRPVLLKSVLPVSVVDLLFMYHFRLHLLLISNKQ